MQKVRYPRIQPESCPDAWFRAFKSPSLTDTSSRCSYQIKSASAQLWKQLPAWSNIEKGGTDLKDLQFVDEVSLILRENVALL